MLQAGQSGDAFHGYAADVCDSRQVEDALKQAGTIDVLVCCAGAASPGYFVKQDMDDFESTMQLNYFGTLRVIKAALPSMVERRQGEIVLVSSAAAVVGVAGYTSYAPTKAAVRSLADTLRNELLSSGVRVMVAYPPDTDTPGYAKENLSKPPVCHDISRAAGDVLFTPEQVAQCMLKGMERGAYHLPSPDFGQNLMIAASAGLSPHMFPAILEFLLSPWVEAGSELDANGVQRLPLRREGWNYWSFENKKVHYIQSGTSGTPVLFLHGFGASAYHWRYNLPILAQKHRVFAMDLLGMGWSDKPTGEDIYQVWPRQIAAFIKEVVGGEPVVLVGNSLGGYNCLKASVTSPDLVRGVVLLNSAGRFEEVKAEVEAQVEAALPDSEASDNLKEALREVASVEADRSMSEERAGSNGRASVSKPPAEEQPTLVASLMDQVKTMALRGSIYASFFLAKQPKRIRQVLEQVYISQQNVDEELVNSIVWPAQSGNAAESFYQIISGKGTPVNVLLSKLDKPLLLLWGADDPWIGPGSAARIQGLYPRAQKVLLSGVGHCPQDDAPERVNAELLRWLEVL
ncbi:hypothetical protein WJX75_003662 [Coccomyxa subellipsoidea]|uniref:AB hydrolase-1 domain-containing protein n=1 Tax=Coccomyxa subellipsoidea TaxID=248742 RepID=A0ABR2YTN5_9CHLO